MFSCSTVRDADVEKQIVCAFWIIFHRIRHLLRRKVYMQHVPFKMKQRLQIKLLLKFLYVFFPGSTLSTQKNRQPTAIFFFKSECYQWLTQFKVLLCSYKQCAAFNPPFKTSHIKTWPSPDTDHLAQTRSLTSRAGVERRTWVDWATSAACRLLW